MNIWKDVGEVCIGSNDNETECIDQGNLSPTKVAKLAKAKNIRKILNIKKVWSKHFQTCESTSLKALTIHQ